MNNTPPLSMLRLAVLVAVVVALGFVVPFAVVGAIAMYTDGWLPATVAGMAFFIFLFVLMLFVCVPEQKETD